MRTVLLASVMALAVFIAAAGASYVGITEPYNATVQNGGSIYLGKVGPGQTFYITISSATTGSTGNLINFGWNEFNASEMPPGWVARNSSLNTALLSTEITVAPNAADGTYQFALTATNLGNYSKLGNASFTAYVNVTPDVFLLSVRPNRISTGPGEPAHVFVTINNTGVSDSPFEISAHGMPGPNATEQVIALHRTSQQFVYSLYAEEPGAYSIKLRVNSTSSPRIYKQANITMDVRASLANDYSALGEGALAFPVIYEPAYAIMYLISLLRHV